MTCTGICLDGPLKGSVQSYFGSIMRVPIPPADPVSLQLTPTVALVVRQKEVPESVKDFAYRHVTVTMHSTDDGEGTQHSFWIDAMIPSGERTAYIMAALTSDYGRL